MGRNSRLKLIAGKRCRVPDDIVTQAAPAQGKAGLDQLPENQGRRPSSFPYRKAGAEARVNLD